METKIKQDEQDIRAEKLAKLAEENINLIYKYLNFRHLDFEEYFDVASVGYMQAVNAYDDSLGYKFSTLAYKAMDNEVINYNKTYNKYKNLTYTFTDLSSVNDEGEEISFEDTLSDEDYSESNIDYAGFMGNILDAVSTQDIQIMYYKICGKDLADLAARFNVSTQWISAKVCRLKEFVKEGKVPYSYKQYAEKMDFDRMESDPLIILKRQYYIDCIMNYLETDVIDISDMASNLEWLSKNSGLSINDCKRSLGIDKVEA